MSNESDISENREKPRESQDDEDFSDSNVTKSQETHPKDVQKTENEETEEERIPREKIMKNINIFDHDVPSLTTKKSIDVYSQKVPKRIKSIEIYGEDGPIVKRRPDKNRQESSGEDVPKVKLRESNDTDDSGKIKESQENHGDRNIEIVHEDSDDGLRKENRKRTYVVPKTKVRQPSAEKQETNLTSLEFLPQKQYAESSGSVGTPVQPLTSTPKSEGHVPVKRKRNTRPNAGTNYKTPSPRKNEELSCHSRTHLRLDPQWVSPKTEKQITFQKQQGGHSRDARKRRRSHRRKRRAKTASDIIKLKVNGNRVTPLIKSPSSTTSQSSGKASKSTERALSYISSGKGSKSTERALTYKNRASSTSRSSMKITKSTDAEQTIMLDSATQTSLRFLVPESTVTEEVQKETPKKKKGWFARCCGRS